MNEKNRGREKIIEIVMYCIIFLTIHPEMVMEVDVNDKCNDHNEDDDNDYDERRW